MLVDRFYPRIKSRDYNFTNKKIDVTFPFFTVTTLTVTVLVDVQIKHSER